MRWNILIGGEAGQGINAIAEIATEIFTSLGYYIFNYRDYQSLIRGGHNFNIISVSEKPIASFQDKIDCIVSIDENTFNIHKNSLEKNGILIKGSQFPDAGRNINLALAGALMKTFGIEKNIFLKKIKEKFPGKESFEAGEKGYNSAEKKYFLKKLNNKINLMTGSKAVALGAFNSGLTRYFAYPMTPATGVMEELASMQNKKNNLKVFQTESEIAVVNNALGASFAGANVMAGTSGGGYDLMTEALSFQGMTEIPLTIYLASRGGPSTGLPTYNSQSDLDIALRGGHGEFPRIVVAPGDAHESITLTNQALFLAGKFNALSIILSDKHVAESQFSFSEKIPSLQKIPLNRKIPSKDLVKCSSYEHNLIGDTSEDSASAILGNERRLKKYNEIKNFCNKYEMIKIHGNKKSKNLVIGWGSTKGAIIDAIADGNLNCKFLQVLYLKPMSNKIKSEIQNAKNVYLIEYNSTGQLGRLLREKTGYKIPEKNRILKYDGRPFSSDELIKELKNRCVK